MNKMIIRATVAAAALAVAGLASAQTSPAQPGNPGNTGEASTVVNGKPNPAKRTDGSMTSRDSVKAEARMQANPNVQGASSTPKGAGEASTSGPNGQPNAAVAVTGDGSTKMERKQARASGSAKDMEKTANARDPKAATPQ